MKKRIFMALLAAVSTFAMVSCGDDKNDDPQPSVATKASFGQDDNSVWLITPLDDDDLKGLPEGSASEKVVWKWDSNGNVTDASVTISCSSKELATALYNQTLAEKDNPESEADLMGTIKDIKVSGTTVTAIYEVEDLTKMDAIVEAKAFAMLLDIEGVEFTEAEQAYYNEMMDEFYDDDDDDSEDYR